MKSIDFTFITIVYKDNLGCLETINSIFESISEYTNYSFEHIIIDGGLDIILKKEIELLKIPYIKLISEPDGGIYDAMNKGIKLASGKFINFLNAGDLLVNNIDWDNIFSSLMDIESDGSIAGLALSSKIKFDIQSFDLQSRPFDPNYPRMPTIHQSMIYKVVVLRDINYSSAFQICGDFDNYIKIIESGKSFLSIPSFYSIFFAGGKSSTKPYLLFIESSKISTKYIGINNFRIFIIRLKLFISLSVFQALFISNKFIGYTVRLRRILS